MPYNPLAYAHGITHSDFCLLPRGEVYTPEYIYTGVQNI